MTTKRAADLQPDDHIMLQGDNGETATTVLTVSPDDDLPGYLGVVCRPGPTGGALDRYRFVVHQNSLLVMESEADKQRRHEHWKRQQHALADASDRLGSPMTAALLRAFADDEAP